MSQVAKLFTNGRSQAIRLPAAYRFDTREVFIHRDTETGDVILSRKPATWDDFFSALKDTDVPSDFLDKKERNQGTQNRGPLRGAERMTRYMLDTNTVSHLIKAHPAVARRVVATPIAFLCVSAITNGELLLGLAKRPDTKRLHLAVGELLRRVDVLPWDSAIAEHYGTVRADMERQGKILGA